MKINKNLFFSFLMITALFSVVKIASADTYQITFTDPTTASSYVNLTTTYQLNKPSYSPGESVTPYTYTNPKSDIRCANGQGHAQTLYMYNYNFEIGKPDLSKTLSVKQMSKEPNLFIDKEKTSVYLYGDRIFTTYNSYSIQITDYNTGNTVQDLQVHSIEEAFIDNSGNLVGNVIYSGYVGGSYVYNQYAYGTILVRASDISPAAPEEIRNSSASIYIPTLLTLNTGQRPILPGTHVYGSETIPTSITIPTNAEPAKYVAQLKFRPSYVSYTPPYGVTKGTWNTAVVEYKTCSNGTKVLTTEACPLTKTCWDGSVVLNTATCPTATYKNCPDGSRVLSNATCPATKTCLDGTIVLQTATCYKDCPGGDRVPEGQVCLKTITECPDGSLPIRGMCPSSDCSDPKVPCKALYMRENKNSLAFNSTLEFLGIKKANARIEALQAETMMVNGGGGGGGGGYTPPPETCGTSWWCKISFYEVPLSLQFEVKSSNTSPSVLVN